MEDTAHRLRELRDGLTRLSRLRDPVARDRLAVELIEVALPILRAVRRDAAHAAISDGWSARAYARALGITEGAVYHLQGPRSEREETT